MKLVRIIAPALCLALSLPLGACNDGKPNGTSNPPGGGGGSPDGDESGGDDSGSNDSGDASGDGGGDEGGDGGEPAAKACDAKVSETPTALFGDKVLIRAPINVELVEENPTFATTYASGGFVSACEATVDRMSLFVFENDKKKGVDKYMEEVINDMLAKSGYSGGTRGKNFVDSKTQLDTEVEYPPAGGQPPAKLYISVKKLYDYTLVTVFQTRPDEFGALKPTFSASTESLIVLPPDA